MQSENRKERQRGKKKKTRQDWKKSILEMKKFNPRHDWVKA